MNLIAADSVLARNDEPRSREPLLKRNRRIFKGGSGLERKLRMVMLAVTLPYPLVSNPENLLRLATRTLHHAIGPAEFHHELAAMLEVRKPYDGLLKGIGRFHASSMPEKI